MKRTNLVLDENLLRAATRLLGAKTYSAAVNQALEETIRVAKVRGLADLFGTGAWEGELPQMRRDRKPPASRRPRRA